MAPPRTTVRNDQILAAIDALSRQVQSRDEPLEARLDEVTMTLADFGRRMDRLEKAWTKEARRDACPFRDDIVSAANNKGRIIALETKAHALEVQMVRAGMYGGAAGGGVIGLLTMLAFGGGVQRGLEILRDMVQVNGGLMYEAERAAEN